MFQTIVNVLDFGMDINQAVTAPRFHFQWTPDSLLYERFAFAPEVCLKLGEAGYALRPIDEYAGRVHALVFDRRTRLMLGGPDYREAGVAVGK